jgi:AP endonuclease-1
LILQNHFCKMPRASPRQRAAVNYNEDEPQSNGTTEKAASKVKSVVAKATPKRKVEADAEPAAETNGTKIVKKRKTKAEKEEEAMPLASRTAVSTLQKGMHIGAHVSAAGGL